MHKSARIAMFCSFQIKCHINLVADFVFMQQIVNHEREAISVTAGYMVKVNGQQALKF